MPWVAKASVNARSRMPPSSAVTPSRPQHNSVTGVALLTPNPRLQPGRAQFRGRALPGLVVACRRPGQQVELGSVCLDLPADGDHAKPRQSEQQQLLHGAEPLHLDNRGAGPEGATWLLTLHAD